jgi:hypothetical protein
MNQSKRSLSNLINHNNDIIDKNLTITAAISEENKNIICSYTGCNEYANSIITLRAGTRIFILKVCKSCKKKLES